DAIARALDEGQTDIEISVGSIAAESMSRTLVHEIEHKTAAAEGGMTAARERHRRSYARNISIRSIIALVGLDTAYSAAKEAASFSPDIVVNTGIFLGIAGVVFLAARQRARQPSRIHEKIYREDPEEIRCREAEEIGPKNLVTISI
ncbi:MAG: hypothetical protein ACREHG_04155, partial [Candidatus Saccharimonadales bacterium]